MMMKTVRYHLAATWVLTVLFGAAASCAADYPHPTTNIPSLVDIGRQKAMFDDPRPYLNQYGPKQVLPEGLYKQLTYDMEEMKKRWSDLVGFSAPGEVGKIAPEIKPGKYTYKDLDKYPGLRKLMYEDLQKRIVKPGEASFPGSISEFEIIPTRQYFWALPASEVTKKNLHKSKLDEKGYLIKETWGPDIPSRSRKAGSRRSRSCTMLRSDTWVGSGLFSRRQDSRLHGGLRMDFEGTYTLRIFRYAGRCLLASYGYFDEAARRREEAKAFVLSYVAPRDLAGAVQTGITYLDSEKLDSLVRIEGSVYDFGGVSLTGHAIPLSQKCEMVWQIVAENVGKDLIYNPTTLCICMYPIL